MKPLLLCLIFCCSAMATAQMTAIVSGVVRDAMAAPIANADVAVHWNTAVPDGPRAPKARDVMVKTDKDGRYTVDVVPGFYDVCVHAGAFAPQCTTVKADGTKNAAYSPRLKPSPVINFAD